ncbi:four helix bundle protein [Candidatus Daviesbacteria bacterium RIFCSPLOWO2_02_FULL_38_18]|nr:MAG: four helix bundle protein [Candidatus Daviesbacteria bacterium RIFCSPHIGHO2_02_FULL_39_41]OGE68495.1 MAG: four helix bundle protein [Candidatus Daviesbacteria bacterium RIFCSPLOWO2_02_FULL_38_18]OGJ20809.1 MAG: four helix bundle protein [Candidatus Nomurabacteria bacterium RIFOXYD2_FULL_42_12]
MTNQTHQTDQKKHGGYRNLHSYQTTTLIYDLSVEFVRLYIDRFSRTKDQMVQAARSGRQNIAEGSQASGTSKKTEIKLVGVARASLEELLIDYEDFLRQRSLPVWAKNSPQALAIRNKTYLDNPETAANCLICLIHQANYLLDRQLQALEKAFIEKGGYSEKLFKKRLANLTKKTY